MITIPFQSTLENTNFPVDVENGMASSDVKGAVGIRSNYSRSRQNQDSDCWNSEYPLLALRSEHAATPGVELQRGDRGTIGTRMESNMMNRMVLQTGWEETSHSSDQSS
ncbi:hypothetical protein B0H13DRAFT_1855421 [Mycena leptocephala]|nr:hypothetical protein B0H13DRAFT_1855421 [Mycena leptocephala]